MTGEAKNGRGTGALRSLWRRIVDISLTDVSTLVHGIDEDTIEELERVLLEADFGVETTAELVDDLERAARRGAVRGEGDLREVLGGRIREVLREATAGAPPSAPVADGEPRVVLLVGVNGTGKTTTAAKLAHRARRRGETALLAATDTFRSGAQAQLRIWAERVGADCIGGRPGGDPAAVAFDAATAARARSIDLLLVDTAGRLHTQRGLMEELRKIDRVLGRVVPGAPHERWLVVDATAGQNVVRQAQVFGEALPLGGLVLTKFDSSARGGTAVAVARELGVPVLWLGTGESVDDLEPFEADRYVEKLLG
ncbi:MAG: signal recognition particle-docking protein FtsY [Gemmatimonadota bacterium]|nr:signal recognition particle-docking protein FtsY [Gemmatimonadota bacterium]